MLGRIVGLRSVRRSSWLFSFLPPLLSVIRFECASLQLKSSAGWVAIYVSVAVLAKYFDCGALTKTSKQTWTLTCILQLRTCVTQGFPWFLWRIRMLKSRRGSIVVEFVVQGRWGE